MSQWRKNSHLLLLALIALSYCLLLTPTLAKANALTDATKQSIDELEHKLDAADANANANEPLRSPSRLGGYFGGGAAAAVAGPKRSQRSLYGFGTRRLQISRSKIPIELDLLVENSDDGERAKRFDDYGHMRFGKRGGEDQFDDYGHMRFGRK